MSAEDHSLLAAHKFNCNPEDTLFLHKLMDSSKEGIHPFTHRIFSHNTWFTGVVVSLIGETTPNTKTGGVLSVKEVLEMHLMEDCAFHPSIKDWLKAITFSTEATWITRVNLADLRLIKKLKNDNRTVS